MRFNLCTIWRQGSKKCGNSQTKRVTPPQICVWNTEDLYKTSVMARRPKKINLVMTSFVVATRKNADSTRVAVLCSRSTHE